MENRVEELRKHLGLNQEDFFGKRIDEIFIHERGNKNEKE